MLAPFSSTFVAKLCRSVWQVTRFWIPARAAASTIDRCTVDGCKWYRPSHP